MATRVEQFTATIPAGTSSSAPSTTGFELDNWEIERIDLEVPDGPHGVMGFYLANNGMPWIPRTPGQWLVWNDRVETIYPTGYPNSSGWEVTGYNEGTFEHAVIVRFHVNPVELAAASSTDLPYITFVEHGTERAPVVL